MIIPKTGIFNATNITHIMKKLILSTLVFSSAAVVSAQELTSPDNNLKLTFMLDSNGVPAYTLTYKDKTVVKPGRMGFIIKDGISLADGFEMTECDYDSVDTVWNTVWGQSSTVRDNHKEMFVSLTRKDNGLKMGIRFRLFNDGLGFRYEFPVQPSLRHFTIENEVTQFVLTGDHKAFWIPADYDTNEFQTTTSKLSEVFELSKGVIKNPPATNEPLPYPAVQTPLMLKSDDGLYINIHEAALIDFAGMHLNLDDENFVLSSHLTPDRNGDRGHIQTGSVSPWRTIVVSDDARDILASNLILNLNEPSKIEDTSWIKPIKYVGVWWEYFTGQGSTWAYSDEKDIVIGVTDYNKVKPNGHHGANTEHVKEYIDFAAEHGFDAVLVEGWNQGWEDNQAYLKEKIYSFTTPYPDFDVEYLSDYAAKKGVKIIMHHETTSSVIDYERQLHDAFKFMNKYGYEAVKTGYVGSIIPRSEHHDGQWMVNHYNYVAETAAKYHIMVDSHEAVRPTGLYRTYPNWLAQESARGTEYDSFNGNNPDHHTILPFTRLMGGPMDYTPGIFEGDLSVYGPNKAKLSTTLAKQLALYITMYSPFQMAADLKENYMKHPDAFQFIKDVAVDWDATYVLEAEPGDYITMARKERGADRWFVGAITDENARTATVSFDFLPKGKTYTATIYADGKNAHWLDNPKEYRIYTKKVTSKDKIEIPLACSGGAAISIE